MNLAEVLDRIPAGAGSIGLLSSDEFTPATEDFDRALIEPGAHVALLTCAGHEHERATLEQATTHLDAHVTLIAHDPGAPTGSTIETHADVIYIPGGDPRALLRCMGGARAWEHILERWRAGATLIGSSAGAMALSVSCLVAEPHGSLPTVWSDGLGPLRRVGIAAHAATRPKQWLQDVAGISPLPVLAIDDATGVLVREDTEPSVIGRGDAWIV